MAKFGLSYQEEQRVVLACRESCESCASMSIHRLAFRTFSLHRVWDGNLEWAKSTAVLFEKVVLVRSDIVFFWRTSTSRGLCCLVGSGLVHLSYAKVANNNPAMACLPVLACRLEMNSILSSLHHRPAYFRHVFLRTHRNDSRRGQTFGGRYTD